MTVGGALSDAWLLYRTLFRRSIVVATVVYAVIFTLDELALQPGSHFAIYTVSLILDIAGPLLVQGALVVLVQDVHMGNRPSKVAELFRRTRPRLIPLVLGSLLYGLLVVVGLLFLIVPGLYLLAHLSVIGPVIVLERASVGTALGRSSDIVRGHAWSVLGVMLISGVFELGVPSVPPFAVGLSPEHGMGILVSGVATILLAPFLAHLLSAIYYRLTDPERPLIDPALTKTSLWNL